MINPLYNESFIQVIRKLVLPYLLLTDVFNPKVSTKFKKEYDYIVVGAGSAGSVIASRLTEDPCVSVLLLEAGGKADVLTEVPAAAFYTFGGVNDWKYKTVPQPHAGLGRKNNVFEMPAGRGLGGSSLLFSPQYFRGNKRDFDLWAKNGAKGWSYEEVLPYFKKSEDNTDPKINQNGYHGTGGYLTVESLRFVSRLYYFFNWAGEALGLRHIDVNGPNATGTAITQGQTRMGRRCSAAKAFLIPAQNRSNLDIIINATVSKVLISNLKRAYGVKFEIDGHEHEVRAKTEVILSAGAYNTPQILMLSGIGPKGHLTKLGIPVIKDLPVGNNFQSHVGTFGPSILTSDRIQSNLYKRFYGNPIGFSDIFNQYGGERLASLNGFEGHAFFNSKNNNPALDWPDLGYVALDFSENDAVREVPESVNYVGNVELNKYPGYPMGSTFTFLPIYLRPKSRGTVRLASANFKDKPIIDPKIYSDPDDLEKVIEAFQGAIKMVTKTIEFQQFQTMLFEKKVPGCEQYFANGTYYSPEYVRCYALRRTFLFFHQAGTCKMGRPTDKTTVVDPQLRVKGIKNLRVADASIMPILPSAPPQPAVVMIGEKASDLIKQDNPKRQKCANKG